MSAIGLKKTIKDSDMNFHGDGMNGDIDIISPNRFLEDGPQAALLKHLAKFHFTGANLNQGFLPGKGSFAKFLFGDRLHSTGSVGRERHSLSGFWAEVAEADLNGIAHGSDYNAMLIEKPLDDRAVDLVFLSQLFDGNLSSFITPDEIISIREFDFSGHVYNLQNKVGWYIANNIITHNCLCGTYPVVGPIGEGGE